MMDGTDDLRPRVDALEEKVDALALTMERRFDGVDKAIAEQGAYTEFAYERLEKRIERLDTKMDAGFEQVGTDVRRVETGLERLERKLDRLLDRDA